jgi:hypothetical protein
MLACDFQHNRRKEKSRVFGIATEYIPVEAARQPNELSVEYSSSSVEKVFASVLSS